MDLEYSKISHSVTCLSDDPMIVWGSTSRGNGVDRFRHFFR